MKVNNCILLLLILQKPDSCGRWTKSSLLTLQINVMANEVPVTELFCAIPYPCANTCHQYSCSNM